MKYFLLLLFSLNIHAFEYPILTQGSSLLTVSTGLYDQEKSYEKDTKTIDQTYKKGYLQTLSYKRAHTYRLSYEIELKVLLGGNYTEKYSGPLNFIPNKEVKSYGLQEPAFKVYYLLNEKRGNFNHYLFGSLTPKLFEAKAHLFYLGRTELNFSYLFNYQDNNFSIDGELFTKIFGKKELRLDSGAEDIIESYTEAGIKFSPGYHHKKFSIHLLSSYSSTTDYNTKNQYFERNSDKGYAVEIGAKLNLQISKNQGFSLSYIERESYFNSIEEDLSRNIEYEIDSEEYKLSWWTLL